MAHEQTLRRVLTETKVLTPDQLDQAASEAHQRHIDLADVLIGHNFVTEPVLYETLASGLKLPFVDLTSQNIRRDVLTLLPEPIIQAHNIVVFDKSDSEVKLAMVDQDDLEMIDFVEKKTGLRPVVYLTTPSSIKAAMQQYRKTLRAEFDVPTAPAGDENTSAKDLQELARDIPVVKLVNNILE